MSKDDVTLNEALEDVEVRFLYNLPESELQQVGLRLNNNYSILLSWYVVTAENSLDNSDKYVHLPHFKFRGFAAALFNHCPLLLPVQDRLQELVEDFNNYRGQIPVFGCILLSEDMSQIVLVKNWSGSSWGFPKGKINQDEDPFDCALRETLEETGFDAKQHCKPDNVLVVREENRVTRLYIATGVPTSTAFATQTRKEISKVEFHPLNNLPTRCYGVYPFLPKLKRWILQYRKKRKKVDSAIKQTSAPNTPYQALKQNRHPSMKRNAVASDTNFNSNFNERNLDTFGTTGATGKKGGVSWGVKAMFETNSKLTGRKYEYDGNPNNFGSSHPRYVNYNEVRSGGGGGRTHGDNEMVISTPSPLKLPDRSSSPSSFQEVVVSLRALEARDIPPGSEQQNPQPERRSSWSLLNQDAPTNSFLQSPPMNSNPSNRQRLLQLQPTASVTKTLSSRLTTTEVRDLSKTRSSSVNAVSAEQRKAYDDAKMKGIDESRKRFQLAQARRGRGKAAAVTDATDAEKSSKYTTLDRPFHFDASSILAAIDKSLAETSSVYSDLLSDVQ